MIKTSIFCGERISRLGMGNMRLPVASDGKIDYAKAAGIIKYLYGNGVNYFDTAYVYHGGESERFLGSVMKDYPRDSYHLATKYISNASPDYRAVFEEQLKRLNTDYIDFYLIHSVNDSNAPGYLGSGCIEYFAEQKRLGRIKHLGFSSHASCETLDGFIRAYSGWEFVQIQLNYLDWTLQNAKGQYETITGHGIPVVVMEPVRGGRLSSLTPETDAELISANPGGSVASWAFRWLFGLENVKLVLSGMSTLEQAEDNIKTFTQCEPLSDADEKLLLDVCGRFRSQISVPCTSCRYCCDTCPSGIDIPAMMGIYNSYRLSGRWELRKLDRYEKNVHDCVSCGACSEHCPQGIDIPAVMRELAEAAGKRS